jgi:hypothetical protein
VNRFGLSRSSDDTASPPDVAGAAWPAVPEEQATPQAGDTLFEIGIIVTLHLAVALAVLVTLDVFGIR